MKLVEMTGSAGNVVVEGSQVEFYGRKGYKLIDDDNAEAFESDTDPVEDQDEDSN